jgi:hypothetical protein
LLPIAATLKRCCYEPQTVAEIENKIALRGKEVNDDCITQLPGHSHHALDCVGGQLCAMPHWRLALLFGWTMYQAWMPLLPGFTWPLTVKGFLVGLLWLVGYSLYGAVLLVLPYNYLVRRQAPPLA